MYSKAVSVTIYSILHVLINFVFQAYLAYEFGAQREMDAYLVSTTVPLLINMILAGSLTFPFLANFVHARQTSGEKEALQIAFGVSALSAVALLIVALVTFIAARGIVRFTAPGLDTSAMDLSTRLLQIQSPTIILLTLAALLTSLHNGLDQFVFPVVVQMGSLAATCILAVILAPSIGIAAVAISMLIGVLIQCLWLTMPLLKKTNMPVHFDLFHPAVQRVFLLAVPLVAGALFVKTDALVDRFIASSLPEGSISHLGYAWRVMFTVSTMVTSGLAITGFTEMSRLAAEDRMKDMHDTFVRVARLLIFILVPVAIFLLTQGPDVVGMFFERGKFTRHDTEIVGNVMACFIGLLLGHGIGQHIVNAFYAIHDTKTPTICLVLSFGIGIVLKFALVGRFAAGGLAMGTSVYYLLYATLACVLLFRRLQWAIPVGLSMFTKRVICCGVGMFFGVYATRLLLRVEMGISTTLILVTVSTAIGVGLYVGLAYALNLREGRLCVDYTRNQFRLAVVERGV